MSATCTIAIQDDLNKYRSIYCNYNGYPEHMLTVLTEKFKQHSQASFLVNGGDVSSIDDEGNVDYYSVRGESWSKARTREHQDNKSLMGETRDTNYTYIFIVGISGHWIGT